HRNRAERILDIGKAVLGVVVESPDTSRRRLKRHYVADAVEGANRFTAEDVGDDFGMSIGVPLNFEHRSIEGIDDIDQIALSVEAILGYCDIGINARAKLTKFLDDGSCAGGRIVRVEVKLEFGHEIIKIQAGIVV